MQQEFEETFVVYLDVLGFSEASGVSDDAERSKILKFLLKLSSSRSEFLLDMKRNEAGNVEFAILPAISVFSDSVVISFQLGPMLRKPGFDRFTTAMVILINTQTLLSKIAALALESGLLIRGGVTTGQLYHKDHVVMGEALIEAHKIESRTAIYSRVVLSSKLASDQAWSVNHLVTRDYDGLYYLNYFDTLLHCAVPPGDGYALAAKTWFKEIALIVEQKLKSLKSDGRLDEFAKWVWFTRKFSESLDRSNKEFLDSLGIARADYFWPWLSAYASHPGERIA